MNFSRYVLLILAVAQLKAYSQSLDTLRYFTPYYPDSLNTVAFIDECQTSGWCEPIGVWFTPDSSLPDFKYKYYSIKEVRFCFGWNYKNIAFSAYLGSELPDDSSYVYRKEISITRNDININFLNDGDYLFTSYDLARISELQNLEVKIPFWIILEAKVWAVYNSTSNKILIYGSNHSYSAGLPSDNWEKANCDWIVEVVVEYHEDIIQLLGKKVNEDIPFTVNLFQNYPNPFNSTTKIDYALSSAGFVELSVYDIFGNRIKSLVSEYQIRGKHSVKWNGTNHRNELISSSVCFLMLETQNMKSIRKVMFIK